MTLSPEVIICGASAKTNLYFWEKGTPFRILTGLTCLLSICGAVLIIASYVFFKTLRNRARLILVHLSLMDLGVALSNLIGNAINFESYYVTINSTCIVFKHHSPSIHHLCETQAFFSHFFTIGSVLWTISLAVYLYCLLMHYRTALASRSLKASYILCYGFPLGICVWLLLSDKFGFAGQGWCTTLFIDIATGQPDIFVAVFGYDLWVYFTMTFVPVLYLAVHLYLREKVRIAVVLVS